VRGMARGLQDGKASLGDAIVSELREVIGALQSEAEFEAAVSGPGAAGIDRARMQLPRVEIGLSDDRQQVRTLATSLAATVASFAGAVLAATGGAAAPALLAALLPGVAWAGWPPCSGSTTKRTSTSG
jgi:hypothetical protein